MSFEKIINKIIPPDDYQHRNGFSNKALIDGLNNHEKVELEAVLIEKLKEKFDMLIVESLSYMKSQKALPILYEGLNNQQEKMAKIITAVSIFEINSDPEMIVVAKNIFKSILDKYELIIAFHYLIRFRDKEIISIIQEYSKNSDYLIAYNAKVALGEL